jgi:hypothetical protein
MATHVALEVGHVLFMDVVGYSELLINDQSEVLAQLNQVVRATAHFQKAEAEGKLIPLATGDGMALIFVNNAEAPVQCVMEISQALQSYPSIQLRTGVIAARSVETERFRIFLNGLFSTIWTSSGIILSSD